MMGRLEMADAANRAERARDERGASYSSMVAVVVVEIQMHQNGAKTFAMIWS